MANRLATYRITEKMVSAGAKAMSQCRDEGGHTPQTVARAVFAAMLHAADIHPGADMRKSFAWSPHDSFKRKGPPKGLPRAAGKLTRADFDEKGVRVVVDSDGTEHKQLMQNFHYLK